MLILLLAPKAADQLVYWQKADPRIEQRIKQLIDESRRTPFSGRGKPEALKHDYSGCWSRRINREHRLVYKVEGDALIVLACRYHY
jgi:toxin YoeB